MTNPCGPQSQAWIVACVLLLSIAPLAIAGIALTNAGFARARAATHVLFCSLLAGAISAAAYLGIGFVWHSTPCLASIRISAAGHLWSVLGSGPPFLRGVDPADASTTLRILFGALAAAMCVLVPIAAASERWRIGPALLASGLNAAFVFPVFAHWSWPSGWLSELSSLPGLVSYVDVGGSGFVHAVGGLWALAVVWITGPRLGKYTNSGMPTATPGHNAIYILTGCFLSLIGSCGVNGAAALLIAGSDLQTLPYVMFNTLACAVGGIISSAFITRVRFGKTDASLCANGWIAGLVSGAAGCTVLRGPEEMLVGLISGTLVVFSIELFELRLRIDDPGGAISVHGLGGAWGILAPGLFLGGQQFIAQACGLSMLLGIVFPVAYVLNLVINRILRYRVEREGERQGLDLHELGSGAYPEFMLHHDDLSFR